MKGGGHGEAARTRRRGGRDWGRREPRERRWRRSGETGAEPQDPASTLCPAWCGGSRGALRHCALRAAAEKQQRGEANEPAAPGADPGLSGRRAARPQRNHHPHLGHPDRRPLRPRCLSPPCRHPQPRNNSCRRGPAQASEGQAGVPPPTAGLHREPRGPVTSRSLPALERPADAPTSG